MRIPLLLAVLGALALAGQAHAATRVATFPANGRGPVTGPVPIGGEVAYGHRLASGRWWLGTTARTLAVLPAPAVGMQANVYLAASSQRAAWIRTVESIRQQRLPDPPVEDSLFSLQAPGPPALVDNCIAPAPGGCRVYGTGYRFAVDGSTLAWMRWAFPGGSPVTIDRGDDSPTTRIDLGDRDPAGRVAAAGGRVAFATTDDGPHPDRDLRVTVVDHDGRELLRIDSSPELTFGESDWVLLADGKLVIWSRQGPAWFSPEEPTAHAIPDPGNGFYAVLGAAGNRIAYWASPSGSTVTHLNLLELDGGVRTIARFPGYSSEGVGFDGTTVAWNTLRCGVIGIWTAPADGSEAPWSDYTGSCPGFAARRPLVGRTRAVVRLQCPHGCRGSVSLALRDAPRKRLARRSIRFRPSPRERIVRLTLDRADRRALREAGRIRPPVVLQRLSGRDGMREPVVAERPRSVRFVR